MPALSERLSVIAEKVKPGRSVCDVGTDHGYLPAYLYLEGRQTLVTATDIREKPLLNAKTNLKKLGAEGVNLILCDGLTGVSRNAADTVIIAGMGGEVIMKIIKSCAFFPDKDIDLILQPMTASHKLRKFLFESGYEISDETPVKEKGKIYSVMSVKYDGIKRTFDNFSLLVGKLNAKTPLGREYIEKQVRIYKKRVGLLEGSGEIEKLGADKTVLCKLIKMLEEPYGA